MPGPMAVTPNKGKPSPTCETALSERSEAPTALHRHQAAGRPSHTEAADAGAASASKVEGVGREVARIGGEVAARGRPGRQPGPLSGRASGTEFAPIVPESVLHALYTN